MQKQSFAHLVATIGPLVAAALAFLGYFGHHQIIAYVACLLCYWKRAYIEDVVSSLQGTVGSVVSHPAASTVAASSQPISKPRIDELTDGLKSELAALDQNADQAVAAKNAGHAKVAALKG